MRDFQIPSKNGNTYTFKVYDPYGDWNPVGGVYIFLRPSLRADWDYLYIGQTEDFSKRMPPNHERWEEARRRGATVIGATAIRSVPERLGLEKELIQRFQPPMNDQLTNGLIGAQMGGLLGGYGLRR